jgi:methylglutaconyl-CoA hydratase
VSHPPFYSSVLEAGTVQTTVADGVATIRFGHPKGNSLPGALLSRLAETIALAGQDPSARVVVLRSDGGGPFCAGASFDELKGVQDLAGGRQFFSGFAKVILAMVRSPKFIVTRVHGKVAGGGVGLVAASDYAIGVEGASLKLSELAIGIGPFVVGPVIERKIGLGAFSAMAVEANWRNAAWAERHGLYAEVLETVPALDHRVEELARQLAGYSPEAMRRLKETFWQGTERWPELLTSRAEISGSLILTDHARTAINRS